MEVRSPLGNRRPPAWPIRRWAFAEIKPGSAAEKVWLGAVGGDEPKGGYSGVDEAIAGAPGPIRFVETERRPLLVVCRERKIDVECTPTGVTRRIRIGGEHAREHHAQLLVGPERGP